MPSEPSQLDIRDPAGLRILRYPAEVLRKRAVPVSAIDDDIRGLVARMIELMREARGIGLAAPQVGVPLRIFLCDVPESDDWTTSDDPPTASGSLQVHINPVITNPVGFPEPYEEGCLSLPDLTGEVMRPPTVTLTSTDLDGSERSRTGAGLLARCWQHEFDHLEGVLIIDKFTPMSRLRNRAALKAIERRAR